MASLKSVRQIKSDGGEFVGQWHDGWQLYAYPVNDAGWRKVQMRRSDVKRKGAKRSIVLSWNGERLTAPQPNDGTTETMREWIADQMRAHLAAKGMA